MQAKSIFGGAVLFLAGCSTPWPEEPSPPPVQPAPAELRSLSIHVHRLASPRQTEQDEWDYHHMPGYTRELRGAFVRQLQQAGYTVVVDRRQPHDLMAVVQAEWPYGATGTATLVLDTPQQHLATFSAAIPVIGKPPHSEHLEQDAAVALVSAMNRSARLSAYAKARPTRNDSNPVLAR